MIVIHSEKHHQRNARTELYGGELVEPFERPSRIEYIVERINKVGIGDIVHPDSFNENTITRIHDEDYITFLKSAWQEWSNAGYNGEAIPTTWPARRMVQKCPEHIDGKLGYYAMACETSITSGTWEATVASSQVALSGATRIQQGQRCAFSLCRPPGHHAALDMYGGYCFVNNAAVATQHLLDNGASRIAIIDVDFHHGNGTQDIFYHRDDVLFVSLHGDPLHAFPHFLGYTNETGAGKGDGLNINFSMPPGTNYEQWCVALKQGLARIADFSPDALVVSLGVDTFENDPISFFKLKSDDFLHYGNLIAKAGFPTLFVMEGGYDIKEIGINTVNVLQGFEGG